MCVNCNIPLPLSKSASKELICGLELPNDWNIIISIRDLISQIIRITSTWDVASISKNLTELLEKLCIKPFQDIGDTNLDITSDDLQTFLGLSDFAGSYSLFLDECNFFNVKQYEITMTHKIYVAGNVFNIGRLQKRDTIMANHRSLPENYPLQQLCFQTILLKAAMLLSENGDEFLKQMTNQDSMWQICRIDDLMKTVSRDVIWDAIMKPDERFMLQKGIISPIKSDRCPKNERNESFCRKVMRILKKFVWQ